MTRSSRKSPKKLSSVGITPRQGKIEGMRWDDVTIPCHQIMLSCQELGISRNWSRVLPNDIGRSGSHDKTSRVVAISHCHLLFLEDISRICLARIFIVRYWVLLDSHIISGSALHITVHTKTRITLHIRSDITSRYVTQHHSSPGEKDMPAARQCRERRDEKKDKSRETDAVEL